MPKLGQKHLLELWDKNICPNCAKSIPEGTRVGSGRKNDGGFCSLGCYGEYHNAALIEKHKGRVATQRKHQNN